jgi:dolichyl-phosphate-mannose-protein mannosyltransferase
MTRRELVLLAVILAVGAALRIAAASQSAVEHFDEGVYASNFWFGPPDYAYPDQPLYAPPLLPGLIEAGMIAGLAPNTAALLPGVVAGSATIAALWWLGRTWFGPRVGLTAAALCAFSEFHIAYSAAALTDALLGLWLVLAVQAAGISLANRSLNWAAVAGIFTGLAWWTKYNGWLPLAIEAAALALLWMHHWARRRSLQPIGAQAACFALTSLVAFAIWCPYLLSLHSQGGYAPIAANHARYIVGLAGWADGLSRQIANQHVIESWLSPLSVPLALGVAMIAAGNMDSSRQSLLTAAGFAVVAGGLALAGTTLVVAGAAAVLGMALVARCQTREPDEKQAVGLVLLAVWWCGLLAVTPYYWPYPRLVLPWQLASWIGAALLFDQFAQALASATETNWRASSLSVAAAIAIGIAAFCGWLLRPRHEALYSGTDRRGLVALVEQVQTEIERDEAMRGGGSPRVIYVYGEPALLFQCCAHGRAVVAPIQTLPTKPALKETRALPTYLVVGPHTIGNPSFQKEWAGLGHQWEEVATYSFCLSHIVALDLTDPRKQGPSASPGMGQASLYRFTGSGTVPP